MELSKQEIELSKQEMESFLLFPDLQSKNFFYKKFLAFKNKSKTNFVLQNVAKLSPNFNPNYKLGCVGFIPNFSNHPTPPNPTPPTRKSKF